MKIKNRLDFFHRALELRCDAPESILHSPFTPRGSAPPDACHPRKKRESCTASRDCSLAALARERKHEPGFRLSIRPTKIYSTEFRFTQEIDVGPSRPGGRLRSASAVLTRSFRPHRPNQAAVFER